MRIALASFFAISRNLPETYRITAIRRLAPGLSLLTLAILGLAPLRGHASLPLALGGHQMTSIAAAPAGGFWVQVDPVHGNYEGGTFAKEGAPSFENVAGRGSIIAIPGGNRYWVVTPTDPNWTPVTPTPPLRQPGKEYGSYP
jgi:hypothetical protein